MKLRELISAYNRLGNATMTKLDDKDVVKALKARKAMRPHAEEYEAFEKDCRDKFKFDGLEEDDKVRLSVFNKIKEDKDYKPTESEIESCNNVASYFNKVNKALEGELEKDIVINIEKLGEGSDVKLMQENKWKPYELEELDMLF